MEPTCPICGDVLPSDSAICYRCSPRALPVNISRWFEGYDTTKDTFSDTWQGCLELIAKRLFWLICSIIVLVIGGLVSQILPGPGYLIVALGALSIIAMAYRSLDFLLFLALMFFDMPIEHKLKSLSITSAAVVPLIILRAIIFFSFSTEAFIAIIICVVLSLIFWLIGSRFETESESDLSADDIGKLQVKPEMIDDSYLKCEVYNDSDWRLNGITGRLNIYDQSGKVVVSRTYEFVRSFNNYGVASQASSFGTQLDLVISKNHRWDLDIISAKGTKKK